MSALLALFLLALPLYSTQGEHPVPLPADFDTAKCVECHKDKQEGKFVHTAVSMGCGACHQVTSEKDKTTITLAAKGGELCATCHQPNPDAVLHGPYKSGKCLACHDPHNSNYSKVTRAEPTTLCFSCHGVNQPGVRIEKETKTVSVLGGQKLTLEEYRDAPKIGLDRSNRSGHPIMGHPIDGKDPRKKDTPLNCLSCHNPHSSPVKALLAGDTKTDLAFCTQCHK